MYICIYVYMYICKYVYMYICIYVYMYICIYVYMYICIYVYMYICIYVCIYIYISMSISISISNIYWSHLPRPSRKHLATGWSSHDTDGPRNVCFTWPASPGRNNRSIFLPEKTEKSGKTEETSERNWKTWVQKGSCKHRKKDTHEKNLDSSREICAQHFVEQVVFSVSGLCPINPLGSVTSHSSVFAPALRFLRCPPCPCGRAEALASHGDSCWNLSSAHVLVRFSATTDMPCKSSRRRRMPSG